MYTDDCAVPERKHNIMVYDPRDNRCGPLSSYNDNCYHIFQ